MASLFDGYDSVTYDEMFARSGTPRVHTRALFDALQLLSGDDLKQRVAVLDRSLRDQGITFSHAGTEWIFPLDLIPRLIPAPEWDLIERGVIQRVRALEAFLADVYGPQTVLADGIVPYALVSTSTNFCRAAAGVEPANGVRVHIAGIDLIRDAEGVLRVLEDNVRVPSGISYVVENRRTMARVFPGLFLEQRVQPVSGHVAMLLAALRSSAPRGVDDPNVVLLTPGIYNSAYFEHAFLARKMGIELVEGRDLFCRSNVLYMRTTSGERRVHVLYRRVDDDYLDPVHFRSESVVGCPGVLNAARAGNVTIANAVGNGVADDKLIYTYVPALIEYYLGEQPILPNVATYRLAEPDVLHDCLTRLGELVLKPVDGSGGYGLLIGPQATEAELAATTAKVLANPRAWIAQEVVMLSTSPSLDGAKLAPRHVDLRPFAINDGGTVRVLPGGLTRVALRDGSLVVNSSQGGGSKDTWVLTPGPGRHVEPGPPQELLTAALAAGAPAVQASAPDLGPQADQQQQQRTRGC
jgi:uncharacterized circularly permuted ATP-grasp superfamily protein